MTGSNEDPPGEVLPSEAPPAKDLPSAEKLQRIEGLLESIERRLETQMQHGRMWNVYFHLILGHVVFGCFLYQVIDIAPVQGELTAVAFLAGAFASLGVMQGMTSRGRAERWLLTAYGFAAFWGVCLWYDRSPFELMEQSVVFLTYTGGVVFSSSLAAQLLGSVLRPPNSQCEAPRTSLWTVFEVTTAAACLLTLASWIGTFQGSSVLDDSGKAIPFCAGYGMALGAVLVIGYTAYHRGIGLVGRATAALMTLSLLVAVNGLSALVLNLLQGRSEFSRYMSAEGLLYVVMFSLVQILSPWVTAVVLHQSGHRIARSVHSVSGA